MRHAENRNLDAVGEGDARRQLIETPLDPAAIVLEEAQRGGERGVTRQRQNDGVVFVVEAQDEPPRAAPPHDLERPFAAR